MNKSYLLLVLAIINLADCEHISFDAYFDKNFHSYIDYANEQELISLLNQKSLNCNHSTDCNKNQTQWVGVMLNQIPLYDRKCSINIFCKVIFAYETWHNQQNITAMNETFYVDFVSKILGTYCKKNHQVFVLSYYNILLVVPIFFLVLIVLAIIKKCQNQSYHDRYYQEFSSCNFV
jgi:hypothetical protein